MSTESALPETLQRALEASARNDIDEALRLLQQSSTEAPGSALPQFLLGAELAQLGRIAEAEAAYANAVLLAPSLHIARYELGTIQFTSGRAAIALLTWQPLLLLPEDDALRMFVQGYTALAQDDMASSVNLFTRGLAANRTNEPLNANIRLVIAGIEKAVAAARPLTAVNEQAEPENSGTHFLVSNYGRFGPH